MKILWFTWKDRRNPQAGGAELVNEELAKRLAQDGHEVIFIVGGFSGGPAEENREGFKITRVGNKWTVYLKTFQHYRKHLKKWPDLVIDEINTIPFFAKFYSKQKNILFVPQLCRRIWFHQIFFPLNLLGYILEPIYLRLLNDRKVITISQSSKDDLKRYGFKESNISIIPLGTELEPVANPGAIIKFKKPTLLSLGAIRSMKRTDHVIKAFELAKKSVPDLELMVAGDPFGVYGRKVLNLIKKSDYSESIQYLGRVSVVKKIELMQRSHLIAVPSVKEGWGLIVTEANSQGTPAVVYNVDGLRDAVKNNQTGLVCDHNTPENMASKIADVLRKPETYKTLQENGWEWSKEINFEKGYKQFLSILNE